MIEGLVRSSENRGPLRFFPAAAVVVAVALYGRPGYGALWDSLCGRSLRAVRPVASAPDSPPSTPTPSHRGPSIGEAVPSGGLGEAWTMAHWRSLAGKGGGVTTQSREVFEAAREARIAEGVAPEKILTVEIDPNSTLQSIGAALSKPLGLAPGASYLDAHEAMRTGGPRHVFVHVKAGTPDRMRELGSFFSMLRGSTQDRRTLPVIYLEEGSRAYPSYNDHWVNYGALDAPRPDPQAD